MLLGLPKSIYYTLSSMKVLSNLKNIIPNMENIMLNEKSNIKFQNII